MGICPPLKRADSVALAASGENKKTSTFANLFNATFDWEMMAFSGLASRAMMEPVGPTRCQLHR